MEFNLHDEKIKRPKKLTKNYLYFIEHIFNGIPD